MSAKHTPGPWFYVGGSDKRLAPYIRAVGDEIGTPAIAKVTGRGGASESLATAQLIAAAPDTAAKAMEFTLLVERYVRGNCQMPDVTESELAEAMYALRAHIAKATGEAS